MSILFMEGFEDVKGPADLQARGEFGSSNSGILGPYPARYSGGNAIVKGNMIGSTLMSRPIAPPSGDSVHYSFQGYVSSSDPILGNSGRLFGPWYMNGQWVATCTTVGFVFTSDDGVNWKRITTSSTNQPLQGICWDPNRNRYTAVATTNNSTTGALWYSPDLVTWTLLSNLSGSASQQTWGIQFIPGSGHILALSNNYLWRLAAGAGSPGQVMAVANGGRPYHIVTDGGSKVWFTSSANGVQRSLDGGSTFETVTSPRGSGSYLSWVEGRLYAGTNVGIDYSEDDGTTFIETANPVTPNGVMMVTHLGANFYARSVQPLNSDLWVSSDGISWNLKPDSLMSNLIQNSNGLDFVNVNDRLFYTTASAVTPVTSGDGEFWSYVPNTGIVSTAPTKGVLNGIYLTSPHTPSQFGTTLYSVGGIPTLMVTSPAGLSSPSTTGIQFDKWYLIESSTSRTGSNSYQHTVSFDGTEVYSAPFSVADYTGYTVSGLSSMSPIVSNGSTLLLATGTTVGVFTPSSNGISSNSPGFNINTAVWTGKNFISATQTAIYVSNDPSVPSSWRLTLSTSSTALNSADVNNRLAADGTPLSTVIVGTQSSGGPNLGTIWRSEDHGETWIPQVIPDWPSGSAITKILFLNDTWMLCGSVAGSSWYTSTDDGLTWQANTEIPLYSVSGYSSYGTFQAAFGKIFAGFVDPSVDTSVRLYSISVSGSTISYQLVPELSTFNGSSVRFLAFNGSQLVVPAGATSLGTYYITSDGISWSSVTGPALPATVTGISWVASKCFLVCSAQASGHRLFAQSVLDYPMSAALDSRSWTCFDDVLVTDGVAPFGGPQGEARIMKLPLDQTVAAEWAPNPSNLTNLEAATAQTASIATSYIESNEVGQEDVYGTSSFSVPPGYRAAAVQVEGYYSRTLNTIPSARFGVRSGSATDATPAVDVTAAIGSKVYVSKIVQQDPATGANWTVSGIANAKITNERTS